MTEQTRPTDTNEAADQLREHLTEQHGGCAWAEAGRDGLLDAALDWERRRTVDNIVMRFCTCGGGKHRITWTHCAAFDLARAILNESEASHE